MINIVDKKSCCGCGACEQVCPKQCISMNSDNEGFVYPEVETQLCLDCGLCEKVCPVINQGKEKEPLQVYAAVNIDEDIRLRSSSGGIFTLLAEHTIRNNGVVFGAIFNDKWEVVHSYTETLDGLERLRRAKYVQSDIGDSFKDVKKFLDKGREVLFVGTPCQVKGLRLFLQKEYSKLLMVDILCHGVPSPKVWQMYLSELMSMKRIPAFSDISEINFRGKKDGWRKFSFNIQRKSNARIISEPFYKNIFMRGFLNDLFLRPSCYKCSSKLGKSGSDITIADYWSIGVVSPEFDDNKGAGLVLINTQKGESVYPIEQTKYITTGYEECQGSNGGFKTSLSTHPYRDKFFDKLDSCNGISKHILAHLNIQHKTLTTQIKDKIKSVISKLGIR